MATYSNDLRLKEITTGDEDGTWGTSTNTNLSLIADAFSLGTKQMAANADETFTMPDATADGTRSLYLKITSAVSLTATRTVTLGPNTVSKVWIIENATTGAQSIIIKQGSGATVTVATGAIAIVVSDGAGAGAAVTNASPSAATVNLATGVTGTLAVANGGTGVTTSTGTGDTVRATSPTLSGPTLNDGYTEEVFAVTGTTPALSPTNGSIQTWTLSANSTPTAGTWAAGQSITLMVDDGTAYSITWSSLAVTWKTDGGSAPTLNTSGFTVIQLWKVSTTIYGARVGNA